MFLVEVRVVPSAGRNKWMLDKAGRLKCYLKNPPERGLANKELIKLFADVLQIAQQEITIVSGATSRTKRVSINCSLTFDQLLKKLDLAKPDLEKQGTLF